MKLIQEHTQNPDQLKGVIMKRSIEHSEIVEKIRLIESIIMWQHCQEWAIVGLVLALIEGFALVWIMGAGPLSSALGT